MELNLSDILNNTYKKLCKKKYGPKEHLWPRVHIQGAFNTFPYFFVQAFKIVVNFWKFSMLLLYILWDDWPIFMISGSNDQLQQELEYTLLKPDCHSRWISKMQFGREDTLEKMPQKRMECFRLLLDYLAWIEHQFLGGIRDSRKAGSLWGMMRGVAGVRKSIYQTWLAKGLGLLCWGFKGVQEEIPSKEASILLIGSVAFPPGQYISPKLHPFHRLFDQDGHQDSSPASLCPDVAPCDFWSFPKLRGCRYETIEEMKEAVTKVIDTLTQEKFHGAFQKLLEWYKCIAAEGDYFEGD